MIGSNRIFFVDLKRLLNFMHFDKEKEVEDDSDCNQKDYEKWPSENDSSDLFYLWDVDVLPDDLIGLRSSYELNVLSTSAEDWDHQVLSHLHSKNFLFVFLGIDCDHDFLTDYLIVGYHFVKAEVSLFVICG